MYKIKSPVLLLIFNRPDTTQLVFEQIRKGKPDKLYIAADGPRENKEEEQILCNKTKDLLKIDWDCEVKTLYREHNLGCKMAPVGGIKWFFDNETEGIVLEDDCLPNEDFFRFCDTLLDKYRDDTRVVHISGSNLNINAKFGKDTYHFSKNTHVWGWASWRRVWANYDENLDLLDDFISQDLFKYVYPKKDIIQSIQNSLIKTKNDNADAWDYQYAFLNFWNNGLCICSNYNLISNIGFDNKGTHTQDKNHIYSKLPLESITEITHPQFFIPLLDADYNILQFVKPTLLQRVKNKIKNTIQLLRE